MGLRGSVRSIKSETMEFDQDKHTWKQPWHCWQTVLNPDGNAAEQLYYNPDGSVVKTTHSYGASGERLKTRFQTDDGSPVETLYRYDDLGRLTRVVETTPDGTARQQDTYQYHADGRKTRVHSPHPRHLEGNVYCQFEGSEVYFGAQGAATVTSLYDAYGNLIEMLFHDARHTLLSRVVALYDGRGRLIEQAQYAGDQPPFPLPAGGLVDPDARKTLEELNIPGRLMSRIRYVYDDQDRCVETTSEVLERRARRSSFAYDEYRNKTLEECSGDSPSSNYDVRQEYEYDTEHNWTQRLVSVRQASSTCFEPSNMERRQITYY